MLLGIINHTIKIEGILDLEISLSIEVISYPQKR